MARSGKQSIKVTSERKHDEPVFHVGSWIAGHLLLVDLGYFKFQLFSCITRNKGYFVSRLDGNVNHASSPFTARPRGCTLRDAVVAAG